MNRTEFREAVDRHGEDLSTWPLPEAGAASLLLANEPEARSILDEARAMRAALAPRAAVRAPAGLTDRILQAAFGDAPATAKHSPRSKATAFL